AQNLTLGNLFDEFLRGVQSKLAGIRSRFGTAQELADQLASAFNLRGDNLVFGYDANKHELTYRVVLTQNLSLRVPLGFNINFANLFGLDGNTELLADGSVRMTFTLGMKLNGGGSVSDRLFIRDFAVNGEAHLSATDARLSARLGIVQLQSTGSSVKTDAY